MSGAPHNATLALAFIRTELSQLQQHAGHLSAEERDASLARVMTLCDSVQQVVSDGVAQMADTGDSLQALAELLQQADPQALPAQGLAGLLLALREQQHVATLGIGQIL